MTEVPQDIKKFTVEEAAKYKNIAIPLRSGILRRAIVRKMDPMKLHPNPDDEFCDPKIGPNDEIISNYLKDIREAKKHNLPPFAEPLMVTRIHPDGYMLLNGHHRWAAALKSHMKQVPIEIINVAQVEDIRKMIDHSKHNKRVTFDLDEVVFVSDNQTAMENALNFPFNKIYKQRLKLGIPSLFYYLTTHDYDVWVYSANYYGLDYTRNLFKHYHTTLDGIITGTGRKGIIDEKTRQKMKEMVEGHYQMTIHIDNNSLTCVNTDTKEFTDYTLSGSTETWAREVMEIIKGLDKHES